MLTAVDAAAAEATAQPFMDDLIATKDAQALSGQLTTLIDELFSAPISKDIAALFWGRGRTVPWCFRRVS